MGASESIGALRAAYSNWNAAARTAKASGQPVIGYVSNNFPVELAIAGGCYPLQLSPDPTESTPFADQYMESSFDGAGRSIFDRILRGDYDFVDLIVVPRSSEDWLQLYYYLCEVERLADSGARPPVRLFDLLQTPFETTASYDVLRVTKLRDSVAELSGTSIDETGLAAAITETNAIRRIIHPMFEQMRWCAGPLISGEDALAVIGAGRSLPPATYGELLRPLVESAGELPIREGPRLLLAGSAHHDQRFYRLVERTGATIVAEDHDGGWTSGPTTIDEKTDAVAALAAYYQTFSGGRRTFPAAELDRRFFELIELAQPDGVVFFFDEADDTLGWDYPPRRARLDQMGIPSTALALQSYREPDEGKQRAAIDDLLHTLATGKDFKIKTRRATTRVADEPDAVGGRPKPEDWLRCTQLARQHQKDEFMSFRARVLEGGEPYAIASAVAPHEIFHALDVPVITAEWYSAVISAKKQSSYYLGLLDDLGYHAGLPRYSSLPFAVTLDDDPERAPYGGLPAPVLLLSRARGDYNQRIFQQWADKFGARYFVMDAPSVADLGDRWWEAGKSDWETLYGSDQLDLYEAQLRDLIAIVERLTGRKLNLDVLAEHMLRINETGEAIGEARDILAATHPLPVPITETFPNVMACTWDRGSEWALDHARAYRDEIRDKATSGAAVCADEKYRLLWVGNGLWFNTAFYRAFEKTHGAVFAWSMYTNFLADGYVKYFRDNPLRALAARHVAMNEQLHLPPWMAGWVIQQARDFGAVGAVSLVPRGDRLSANGTLLAKTAMERAGIPVLEVGASMVDEREWNDEEMRGLVSRFIDDRLAA